MPAKLAKFDPFASFSIGSIHEHHQMIPYGRQNINEDDIAAVVEVLKSNYLTQGPLVPRFEQAVAQTVNAEYAIAVNSATSALHIACLALDIGHGDIVWTSPITFVASANCALYCGASIDFVDIDPRTFNICINSLEQKLADAERQNKLPKVVIPVHMGGLSCEMKAIHKLSQQYGFQIIEDASHAIGGKYLDSPIGCCQYSDITIFSFHPVKIITSGEGGMAVTNDAALARQMSLLRSHGIIRDPDLMTEDSHGPWYYQQIALGFNYRMTDIHAALGLSQTKRLHDFVRKRHALKAVYDSAFAASGIQAQHHDDGQYSALHLYLIQVPTPEDHLRIFKALRDAGILVNLHYIPVHLQPWYQKLGFKKGDFPNAESFYRRAISLPLFPDLSAQDQHHVIDVLKHGLVAV